ncbi:Hypothetical protein FKW44_008718 [Caligus rogercresseyi]|uniref:Uncharacterized protein n=1 Tax=Caligus rogercresseyi TaxID=217165 RepID=A0A7T8KGI2_CALRO|nr:Hypothetical protein FKW44_008718 [Caligus rogercresseyi]
MTSSGPSTAAATTTTTTTPYMKKSLTLPRKRPTNKNGSSVLHNGSRIQAPSSRVNTTPSTHRGGGGSFGSNNSSVVSSTPAHKGTRPHHKFSQPGLPSPIVKHSRFKK